MRIVSSLLAGVALSAACAASALAATETVKVTFSGAGYTAFPSGGTAPKDPVTGSFTLTFDPTQTYTDATAGITLDTLNISLGSPLAFDYTPTGPSADVLFVGGTQDTVKFVQYSPSTNDFLLDIKNFTTAPAFLQIVYAQTSAGNYQFYTTDPTISSVGVTPVSSVPESTTWAMLLLGFAGLGAAGYRRAARATA